MKNLLKLFATFFKIGLFTFGGGYAMISFIEDECVNKHKFISEEEMKEIDAFAPTDKPKRKKQGIPEISI